ncbi:MAG TPA: TonB-dependent receptor [candidate division WOR-3 bacterium]|uniref:TonB-dependent receptor n=1 Tax=candidate division WOR-3 bacterium TaxID=2052148 RepID=A0A7V0T767_UNCW3|nr:TonB-dependent receptor [candidate division WOR-3 bacterium]
MTRIACDRVPVLAFIPAPFTTAQQLVETEAFLLGLIAEPAGMARAGRLTGRVFEAGTGNPVPWANVVLEGSGLGAAADSAGRYAVTDIPAGEYEVTASAVGYGTETSRVSLRGQPAVLDFRLRPARIDVAPIDARAEAPVRNLGDRVAPTRVVTRRDIEERGADNIQDALRAEPGVTIAACCPVSGSGEIQLQGLDGKYTTVLLDGMPGLADLGSYGLAHVPVTGVERVEIATGAGGLTYGGEAFGGVVNVVPSAVRRTGGMGQLEAGSFGNQRVQAGVDAKLDRLDASATLSRRQTGASDIDGDGVSDFPASTQTGVSARLLARLHERLDLTLSGYSWTDERRGGAMDRVAGRSDTGLLENPNIASWGPMAVLRWQAGAASLLTGRGSWSGYRQRVFTQERWLDAFEEVGYGDLQYAGQLPFNQRLSVTLSGRHERLTENTSPQARTQSRLGLVAEDELSLGPVTVIGTGRLERFSRFGTRFMPGAAVMYAPTTHVRLRGSYGTGFRAPSLYSKLAQFCAGRELVELIQNPDLAPERSRNAQLSAELSRADYSFSVGLFHNRLFDMVTDSMVGLDTARNVRQYRQFNRGEVMTRGVNLGAAFRPLPGLLLRAGYSLLDAQDAETGRALPYRSRHAASWTAGYNLARLGLSASLSGEFVGGMPTQRRHGEHLVEGPMSPNHALWHARLAKRWGGGPDAGVGYEAFVSANNLTDFVQDEWIAQEVPLWGPTRGRWFLAGLKLSF